MISEEEINEIVKEHYGFTIDEIDENVGKLSLRVNQLEYNNKKLQQELTDCKKKIEMYENPDDLTLFYMWLDEKAKDKIKELTDYKERNEKAIEYIKDTTMFDYEDDEVYELKEQWFGIDLLEILDKKEVQDE